MEAEPERWGRGQRDGGGAREMGAEPERAADVRIKSEQHSHEEECEQSRVDGEGEGVWRTSRGICVYVVMQHESGESHTHVFNSRVLQ